MLSRMEGGIRAIGGGDSLRRESILVVGIVAGLGCGRMMQGVGDMMRSTSKTENALLNTVHPLSSH